MADLNFLEQKNIENFLGMSNGYVLDFSDRTFKDFVGGVVGLNIDDEKYYFASNSKANRLRQFIKVESNYTFGVLLSAFCDYWYAENHSGKKDPNIDEFLYSACLKIAERLKQERIVEEIDAIQPNVNDRDFNFLAKSIRESIERNEPEAALDRLHTFTFRYLRELCSKHDIKFHKSESLNAVFGKYVKFIVDNKHIESVMAEKILKYSINVLDAFNDIRNEKSFAHDNPVLNYQESVLILNNISSTIKFIQSIETRFDITKEPEQVDWTTLSF